MAGNKKFKKLLEPYRIGSVKTRNRIIKTGAALLMWHETDLRMNARMLAYYEALARGGVGLLIVESPTIDYPRGVRWRNRYRIDNDRYIKGLAELTKIIHRHNCPTFMQMNHDGPWQARLGFEPKPPFHRQPIAASPVSFHSDSDFHNEMPRELTAREIEEIVNKFADAAVRAQKAGFDGVDINAASSHLFHNFLSPFWNRRQDRYGGVVKNRARFLVETIQEIKKRLGKDFPVSVCINGIEVGQVIGVPDEKCLTPEDSRNIAVLLEEAGANAIQVRNHWLGYHVGGYLPDLLFYPEPPIPLEFFPDKYDWSRRGAGANINLAANIKDAVSVPVIVVGRLDPVLGEKVLREGKADFIGMTRRLIADPELPNKVTAGLLKDITPCTACENCLGSGRCRINALFGTEHNTIERAETRKKVVVVGGGPAGMEAARVAALRGHDVTLYEKSRRLGGLLRIATVVKGAEFEDLPAIIRYLKRQLKKLRVKVRLGKEFDLSAAEKLKPDVVIVAVGGVHDVPKIPGINRRNVIDASALYGKLEFYLKFLRPQVLRRLTKFWMPIGKNVVIIGGGISGCELGEFLTRRGRKVTILETADSLGEGMVDAVMAHLFQWFQKKGVTMLSGVESMDITDNGIDIITSEGEIQIIQADSIIPALPLKPDTRLLKSLEGKVPELYTIGDCSEPRLIVDAISDGARVAGAI